MLDKYGSTMPALSELRNWYLAECDRCGQRELGELPWTFATFDNGRLVTALHRRRYRDREDLQNAFPCPYSTGDINRSYYHWFDSNDESRVGPAAGKPAQPVSIPAAQSIALPNPVATNSPCYRVFLSICGADGESAATAAWDLAAQTYCANPLY